MKLEACAIIFSTASPVSKFMKQRNKKILNVVYVTAQHPLFSFYLQRRFTNPETCKLTFTTASSIPNILILHFFFQYRYLLLFVEFRVVFQ